MPTGGSDSTRITLDDYWNVFGKVIYRINSQWDSFLQVKNLLDNDYQTPTIGSNLSEGVTNRGRELLLGVSWNF